VQERRRHPRSYFEADIRVRSESAGIVPGRGLDISESGMAAILPVELKIGENVDLEFKKSAVAYRMRASVRNKSIYRHGFEFLPLSDRAESNNLCESCFGTGSIYKPLGKDQIASMKTKCPTCGGTGHTPRSKPGPTISG
jgi:DnaJ-class molecular chaperone